MNNHQLVTLVCLILMTFGMGVLASSYLEAPRSTRVIVFTTMFVAAVTCGIIIGRIMEARTW